jgi:multidrug efflux pump subunit AcrA (membrane-fusion protein)
MKTREPGIRLAVCALCLGLALTGCVQLLDESLATPTPIPTPVEAPKAVHEVTRGDIVDEVTLLGVVDSRQRVNLFFRSTGHLKGFRVGPGEKVEAGQSLAELDVGLMPYDLARAQKRLEMAELRMARAAVAQKREMAEAQRRIETAELRLAQALTGNDDPDLADARSGLENAEVALQKARREYYRVAESPDAGASPQAAAFEQATVRYGIARAAYDRVVELLVMEDEAIGSLQKDIDLARGSLGLLAEQQGYDRTLLEKEVELAQIEVELLQAQIEQAQLQAPFDGVVRYTLGEAGQLIQEYESILGLADTSALEVRSTVHDADAAAKLRIGQEAVIVFRGYPDRAIKGKLVQVSAPVGNEIEEEDRLPIRIEFSAPELDLDIGTFADVQVIVDRKENVLLIPNSTIHSYFNRRYVLVQQDAHGVEDDRKVEVDVILGVSDAEKTEVLSGLQEGERVFER